MSKKFLKNLIVITFTFLLLLLNYNDAPAEDCSVSISPATASIEILGTIQFSGTTSEDGCTTESTCYTWEITERAGEESTIDTNGFYTAGNTEGTEIVTVTDTCNENISDTATVIVSSDSDDEGNCPDSNLEATITIGECDSGVVNQLFENDCTMSDLIAQCAESAGNHGKFVSCVAHLTNDWKKDGFISGKEKGAIQSCAAKSDIPSTTTTIITSVCTSDEECDDGLYCNGYETCEDSICQAGSDPCPDDGLFCTGEESCDEESDACTQSDDPCNLPLTCDEENDVCTSCSIDAQCDDGIGCTADSCVDGNCQNIPEDTLCDDFVDCTDDVCHPTQDCQSTPNNGNCDDEIFCNGVEICDPLTGCQSGTEPCSQYLCDEVNDRCNCDADAQCDDGLFCNGLETCEDNICQAGSDPCPDDEPFCNEGTKECLSESQTPTIKLIPGSALRSHLTPLPLIMVITGNNTHFNETTTVDFSDDDILLPTPLVLSPTSILLVSLINRAGLGTAGDTEVVVTVTFTSDTGVVVVTEPLTLNVLPGF